MPILVWKHCLATVNSRSFFEGIGPECRDWGVTSSCCGEMRCSPARTFPLNRDAVPQRQCPNPQRHSLSNSPTMVGRFESACRKTGNVVKQTETPRCSVASCSGLVRSRREDATAPTGSPLSRRMNGNGSMLSAPGELSWRSFDGGVFACVSKARSFRCQTGYPRRHMRSPALSKASPYPIARRQKSRKHVFEQRLNAAIPLRWISRRMQASLTFACLYQPNGRLCRLRFVGDLPFTFPSSSVGRKISQFGASRRKAAQTTMSAVRGDNVDYISRGRICLGFG